MVVLQAVLESPQSFLLLDQHIQIARYIDDAEDLLSQNDKIEHQVTQRLESKSTNHIAINMLITSFNWL